MNIYIDIDIRLDVVRVVLVAVVWVAAILASVVLHLESWSLLAIVVFAFLSTLAVILWRDTKRC